MEIIVKKGNLSETKTQAVVLAFCEDEKKLSGLAARIDQDNGGMLKEVLQSGDFSGKSAQVSLIYSCGSLPYKRIALVGLGKKKELNPEIIRNAYARVMQNLRGLDVREAATTIDTALLPGRKEKIVAAVVEGARLGLYQYTPYKTVGRDELKDLRRLTIVCGSDDDSLVRDAVKKTNIITQAVCFARDLVAAPGNEMTPDIMASHAIKIAKRKNLSCSILDKGQMKALGMNALLGVAAGSHQPPKLIILEYRGGKKGEAPLALVGKGLTFDSGGISLKPAEKMDEMKSDMAGGATVLSVMAAAADLNLRVNLVGLVPATENMSGGGALKPGDVLKSFSGQTIEVLNTDAEGRLILADALTYALKFEPKKIIDIATLTGACIVALGEEVIGMMGTDDRMKRELSLAGEATGERVWELPLWDHYIEMIKSDIADYKNTAGRNAGAITGAAFLSKFVGDCPWVHLDIAGPSWSTKDKPYVPKGATGVPVRLLIEYLQGVSEK